MNGQCRQITPFVLCLDLQAQIGFYRDTLGLEPDALAQMPMPGGVMHRVKAGSTVIKLLAFEQTPQAANPPGGIAGGSGFRYFTITVKNLDEATAAAEAAGYAVPMAPRDLRPGIRISMIEDADGNWVELLQLG